MSIRRIVGLALVVINVSAIAGCSDDDAAGVRPPAASALPPDVEDDVVRGEEGVDWSSVEPATGATTGSAMPERLDFVGAALAGEEGTPFSFATVQGFPQPQHLDGIIKGLHQTIDRGSDRCG